MPHVVADTDTLVADGVISDQIAAEIEARGRAAMVTLAINAVLCFGILSATGGLIFWLADALSVAVVGLILLALGLLTLARARAGFAMFGNSAALIGAGMLIGGAGIELVDNFEDIAGPVMTAGGALVAAIAGRALAYGGLTARFVAGSILLMGLALHLCGVGFWLWQNEVFGLPKALFYLYAAALIAGAGVLTDVRLITALALVPFAQVLDTGTDYFHAVYVFYSPESTLSIVQMGLLIGLAVWLTARQPERLARHARITATMAFIIANLCALVGSLWGDLIGESIWGPDRGGFDDWESYQAARDAFEASALRISEDVYTILWAAVLAVLIFWSAHRAHRALFNTAITFAAIHAYTQMFESFGNEPLAWVIAGFAAIPLAWWIWWMNQRFPAASGPA